MFFLRKAKVPSSTSLTAPLPKPALLEPPRHQGFVAGKTISAALRLLHFATGESSMSGQVGGVWGKELDVWCWKYWKFCFYSDHHPIIPSCQEVINLDSDVFGSCMAVLYPVAPNLTNYSIISAILEEPCIPLIAAPSLELSSSRPAENFYGTSPNKSGAVSQTRLGNIWNFSMSSWSIVFYFQINSGQNPGDLIIVLWLIPPQFGIVANLVNCSRRAYQSTRSCLLELHRHRLPGIPQSGRKGVASGTTGSWISNTPPLWTKLI